MASESNRLNALTPPVSASLLSDPKNLLMVKDSVAPVLRDEIIRGNLAPEDRIVEGKWAARLGVPQTSIREAINSLMAEGFVQKASAHTATVTSLIAHDLLQLYHLPPPLHCLPSRL